MRESHTRCVLAHSLRMRLTFSPRSFLPGDPQPPPPPASLGTPPPVRTEGGGHSLPYFKASVFLMGHGTEGLC